MRELVDILKALADGNRLRALLALRDEELCVCQIIELLELAPSSVSKHMQILRQARLVDARKEGRWVYYRLPGDDAPEAVRKAIAWLLESVEGDTSLRQDEERLKAILKMDPAELCRRQCCR